LLISGLTHFLTNHNWKLIGYDWSNPDNKEAWKRLYKKWMEVLAAHDE